jgi:hypothetical protein
MIKNGLIITGGDAELLSRALAEVKTKAYEESEMSLDDTQALAALVSCAEKEGHHAYLSLLSKRLVLGTFLDKPAGVERK